MSSIPLCLCKIPTIRNSAPLSLFTSPWLPSRHSLSSSSSSSSPWQSKSRFPSLAVSRCLDSNSAPAPPPEEDEWLSRLPDKKKPLYSHSLPCIEAWLRSLGFSQSRVDRAAWLVHKPEWHAQLSLDVTDLLIRYIKTGPGNLEKDMERRFSYALSREDIENAVLGGP